MMNFFMNRKHKRTWLISEIFHGSPPRGINWLGPVSRHVLARNIANAGSRQGGGRLGEMPRRSTDSAHRVNGAPRKFNGLGKRAEAIERVLCRSVSAADLNFLVHHVAVRHPEWFSDEVAPVDGARIVFWTKPVMCVVRIPSEGRRSCDHETWQPPGASSCADI